jgi:hypothetical protein
MDVVLFVQEDAIRVIMLSILERATFSVIVEMVENVLVLNLLTKVDHNNLQEMILMLGVKEWKSFFKERERKEREKEIKKDLLKEEVFLVQVEESHMLSKKLEQLD